MLCVVFQYDLPISCLINSASFLIITLFYLLSFQRASAKELLKHRFIRTARKSPRLLERIRCYILLYDYHFLMYFCSEDSFYCELLQNKVAHLVCACIDMFTSTQVHTSVCSFCYYISTSICQCVLTWLPAFCYLTESVQSII